MLSDYIDYGIPQAGADGARTLAFDRQVEYLIYRTLPHTLGRGSRMARRCRSAFSPARARAKCARSASMRRTGRARAHRVARGQPSVPMERPIETARALQRMLNSLKAAEGDGRAIARRSCSGADAASAAPRSARRRRTGRPVASPGRARLARHCAKGRDHHVNC
jgi:hypothetical protein